MKSVINLQLRERRTRSVASQFQRSFWSTAIVAVAVVTVTAIGLLSFSLFLTGQVSAEEQKIRELEQRIAARSRVEQRQALLIDRVTAASMLLAERAVLRQKLVDLWELLPPGITIQSLSADAVEEPVSVTVLSPTYEGLPAVVEAFIESRFSTISVVELTRDEVGVYQLVVEVSP